MKIRIALCQVDMEWEHTARNLERIEPVVAAADADVVVLPEMFATGFKLRPSVVAEPADGLVVTTMRRWAATYGKAIVGSAVILDDGTYRNRMFFVKPSGETEWYDKRHLFRPARGATTPRATGVWWSNTWGSAFCCKSATICVSRFGAAIGATTTPSSIVPRGTTSGAMPGVRCCVPGRSRTSVM